MVEFAEKVKLPSERRQVWQAMEVETAAMVLQISHLKEIKHIQTGFRPPCESGGPFQAYTP